MVSTDLMANMVKHLEIVRSFQTIVTVRCNVPSFIVENTHEHYVLDNLNSFMNTKLNSEYRVTII
jgi:hypothetical protein